MHTDPRFAAVVDEVDGQIRLRISAARALELDEAESLVLETGLEELLGLARVPEATRVAFRDPGRRLVLVNGWQSWSYAGELGRSERVRPTLLKGMAPFSQPPCRPAARGEFLSHFYVGLRAGEERLLLVSRNAGTPPVTFRLGRRTPTLRVGILADGARLEAGAPVAELRLFHRTGCFGAKDAFRAAFGGFGHFDRLAFLGQGGSLMPGGYESWYNHYTKIDEAMIEEDLEALVAEPNLIRDYYLARGRPTVFQIDDGWQRTVGEWEIHEGKFPRGLKRLAARAEEKGLVPGLWLAPLLVTRSSALFRERPEWLLRGKGGRLVSAGWNPNWEGDFYCLDLSIPEVGDYLEELFGRVVEDWGFRYLKLDFLYAGFMPGKRARGGAAHEHYERVIGRITSRVADRRGRPVAWLGCGAPLEASFRHFPLMRIGADTRESWEWPVLKAVFHEGRPAAYTNLLATIGRSLLDGTVFVNDPDVVFCRGRGMALGEAEKELVALVDFLLASQIMFSDSAADSREPGAAAFTARMIGLYDALAGLEFCAERLERDVFSLRSRDGRVRGVANLGDRPYEAASGTHDRGRPLVERLERGGGTARFAARSISLFEAE